MLDTLLLVFIVVELLFAVRTTVEKRELVAEPFLLVGIIASIKKSASAPWRRPASGVLGVLVVLLGLTFLLLRRKEREPDDGAPSPREGAR